MSHNSLKWDTSQLLRKLIYWGRNNFCPVCNSSVRRFYPAGVPTRPFARCAICGSYERHRMIWLYFQNETDLFSDEMKCMLHIAPEPCFVSRLMKMRKIDYLTADLSKTAMVQMDITNIEYPDNSFDVIYCSHVLEHIVNDRKAMRELFRVLKPGGWSILQVPIERDRTFEDITISDPVERERLFGQRDHVRVYGYDYEDRLREVGYDVSVVSYLDRFTPEMRLRYGLTIERDDIYYCRK